jgi:hypothetical protein
VASGGQTDSDELEATPEAWSESIAAWTLSPDKAQRQRASVVAGAIEVDLPSSSLLSRTASAPPGSSSASQQEVGRTAAHVEPVTDVWQMFSHAWSAVAGYGGGGTHQSRETVRLRVSASVLPTTEQAYKLDGEDDAAAHTRRVAAARPALPSLRSSNAFWALGGVVGPAVTAINGAKAEAALDEAGLQAVLLCSRHSLRGLAAALAATGSSD